MLEATNASSVTKFHLTMMKDNLRSTARIMPNLEWSMLGTKNANRKGVKIEHVTKVGAARINLKGLKMETKNAPAGNKQVSETRSQ